MATVGAKRVRSLAELLPQGVATCVPAATRGGCGGAATPSAPTNKGTDAAPPPITAHHPSSAMDDTMRVAARNVYIEYQNVPYRLLFGLRCISMLEHVVSHVIHVQDVVNGVVPRVRALVEFSVKRDLSSKYLFRLGGTFEPTIVRGVPVAERAALRHALTTATEHGDSGQVWNNVPYRMSRDELMAAHLHVHALCDAALESGGSKFIHALPLLGEKSPAVCVTVPVQFHLPVLATADAAWTELVFDLPRSVDLITDFSVACYRDAPSLEPDAVTLCFNDVRVPLASAFQYIKRRTPRSVKVSLEYYPLPMITMQFVHPTVRVRVPSAVFPVDTTSSEPLHVLVVRGVVLNHTERTELASMPCADLGNGVLLVNYPRSSVPSIIDLDGGGSEWFKQLVTAEEHVEKKVATTVFTYDDASKKNVAMFTSGNEPFMGSVGRDMMTLTPELAYALNPKSVVSILLASVEDDVFFIRARGEMDRIAHARKSLQTLETLVAPPPAAERPTKTLDELACEVTLCGGVIQSDLPAVGKKLLARLEMIAKMVEARRASISATVAPPAAAAAAAAAATAFTSTAATASTAAAAPVAAAAATPVATATASTAAAATPAGPW